MIVTARAPSNAAMMPHRPVPLPSCTPRIDRVEYQIQRGQISWTRGSVNERRTSTTFAPAHGTTPSCSAAAKTVAAVQTVDCNTSPGFCSPSVCSRDIVSGPNESRAASRNRSWNEASFRSCDIAAAARADDDAGAATRNAPGTRVVHPAGDDMLPHSRALAGVTRWAPRSGRSSSTTRNGPEIVTRVSGKSITLL